MKFTNRLAREKSPYLLQHAHNPVEWFAWRDEAFQKARSENKPIFLSIGYSTCHWCHVMERESFEDEKIASFLREHFISIKVDREERPDVDKIYMTFVQSTSGGGGWPLNVFLTPDLKPFFGGTYFPPQPAHGRPSFLQLLEQISNLWRERKNEILASANELHSRLELITTRDEQENVALTPQTLKHALELFKDTYDSENGGFGGAPKFPQPSIPSFVLRAAKRFGNQNATEMVLHTCDRMNAGGIHDQLGGGFARYAVDAQWLVPHFEKMLYDNAQLVQLYLDAHLVEKCVEGLKRSSVETEIAADPSTLQLFNSSTNSFAAVARDILDYVLRDMTHPDGGFFSAEDADSEGHEGKFYCWTREELSKLLTPEEFNVAGKFFGITVEGNFIDHSHPQPLRRQNVLSVVKPKLLAADEKLLASAKSKMFAAREKRIHPHLDDKILASWNGLMLGAFARAGIVLGEKKYLEAAEKNLKFLREKLWQSAADILSAENGMTIDRRQNVGGTLFHRWRDGERDEVQLLESYAFLLSGVTELYEATLDAAHLDFAIELAEGLLEKFFDFESGGFWQSAAGSKDLILRVKDDYDGAEPSGNSVAVLSLLKLGKISGRKNFTDAAEKTLRLFAARLQTQPAAHAFMLHALDFWLDEPRRVVVAGNSASENFQKLLRAAHSIYQPNKIVLGNSGAVEEFAKSLSAKSGATVFVCTGEACQPPTADEKEVREFLEKNIV